MHPCVVHTHYSCLQAVFTGHEYLLKVPLIHSYKITKNDLLFLTGQYVCLWNGLMDITFLPSFELDGM